MKRSQTDKIKAECQRLLDVIYMVERCAGWTRYVNGENLASSTQHPDDVFGSSRYAVAVKRASMDLTRALVEMRR